MKTRYLFLVPLSCMLLCACTNVNDPSKSDESKSEEVSSVLSKESEHSSIVDITETLKTPILTVNESLLAVSWSEIENATNYDISFDGGESTSITTTIYELNKTEGQHYISVKAINSENHFLPSAVARIDYEIIYTELGELTYANSEISWSSVKGLGVEYKLDNGQYQKAEGNSIRVSGSGSYSVKAKSGLDRSGDKYTFYVADDSKVNTRTIIVSAPATKDLVLEAGTDRTDSGLQEKYNVTKYSDGWKASSASISLNESNEGFTDGKCVKLGFWRHGEWFKFEKKVTIDGTYDTLRFFAKGVENSKLILSFEIKDTKYFGDIAIKGVYITYRFDEVSDEWTEYAVSMADSKWQIDFGDGNKLSPDNFVLALKSKGINVNSLADVLPYFDVFQIRCLATADSIGSNVYYYLDEIRLTNDGVATSSKQIVRIKDTYACEYIVRDQFSKSGTFVKKDNSTAVLTVSNMASYNVSYSITDDQKLKIKCENQGWDFEFLMKAIHNGDEFEYDSEVSGKGNTFIGTKMAAYAVVDDFESYESTGQGYDYNNKDDTNLSGLRAAYYSEYYTGNTTEDTESPLGGNGWSVMKSTDYAVLNTDEVNNHGGSKSARFKYNPDCDCRYVSYGSFGKTSSPLPSGSVFSFWTKGVGTRDNTLKVKVYLTNDLNRNNHTTSSLFVEETFVIPADSDWVECKINLKPGTAYYGYSFHPLKKYDGKSAFFFIDDITIYSSISPWGNE